MKLSIITVNLNNLEGLKKTYESVVSQTFKDYEWLVIDGGSTDGSREFIEQHQDKFAYWCSEPDKGIYNAMNKGVLHAHGQYCLFLNSGDHFYGNKILKKAQVEQWENDFICYDIIMDNDSLHKYQRVPDFISDTFLLSSTLPHQSTLIRTILLKESPYLENLKIGSDWFFFYESLAIKRCSYKAVHLPLSVFYSGGVSSDTILRQQERHDCLRKYHSEAFLQRIAQKQDKTVITSMVHFMRVWIYNHVLIYINYFIRKILGKI